MIFRDFVELVRDGLEAVAFGLGERDLTPMLHLESAAGLIATHPVEGWFFSSSAGTQLLVERYVLPLVRQERARHVAWTFCAWSAPSTVELPSYELNVRPSEHPERREILLATFIDPEVIEHWAAPLVRDPDLGAMIGAWASSLPNVGGGPMLDAIQKALR